MTKDYFSRANRLIDDIHEELIWDRKDCKKRCLDLISKFDDRVILESSSGDKVIEDKINGITCAEEESEAKEIATSAVTRRFDTA